MKDNRVFHFCLFTFLVFTGLLFLPSDAIAKNSYHCFIVKDQTNHRIVKTPTEGGIREEIPNKFRERYERWKSEFLAAERGREQWNRYSNDKNFILIIKISEEEKQGAGTSDYLWNENGNLVGATIHLGSKIEKGYPDPIYFPVMNSLSIAKSNAKTRENILAAAKIAHEFGHVNQTAKTSGELFRRQNELIVEYNEILQKNNFDMKMPVLAKLKEELGGTPVEIWENREYWGETNAMLYLLDRIETENFYCPVVSKIENNIKSFAVSYEDRFSPVFKSSKVCRN